MTDVAVSHQLGPAYFSYLHKLTLQQVAELRRTIKFAFADMQI